MDGECENDVSFRGRLDLLCWALKITMLNHLNQRTMARLDWKACIFMYAAERQSEVRRWILKTKQTETAERRRKNKE